MGPVCGGGVTPSVTRTQSKRHTEGNQRHVSAKKRHTGSKKRHVGVMRISQFEIPS